MNMQNIFPTPVALFKYEGLSEEIIKYLTEQKQRPNTGNNSR